MESFSDILEKLSKWRQLCTFWKKFSRMGYFQRFSEMAWNKTKTGCWGKNGQNRVILHENKKPLQKRWFQRKLCNVPIWGQNLTSHGKTCRNGSIFKDDEFVPIRAKNAWDIQKHRKQCVCNHFKRFWVWAEISNILVTLHHMVPWAEKWKSAKITPFDRDSGFHVSCVVGGLNFGQKIMISKMCEIGWLDEKMQKSDKFGCFEGGHIRSTTKLSLWRKSGTFV